MNDQKRCFKFIKNLSVVRITNSYLDDYHHHASATSNIAGLPAAYNYLANNNNDDDAQQPDNCLQIRHLVRVERVPSLPFIFSLNKVTHTQTDRVVAINIKKLCIFELIDIG